MSTISVNWALYSLTMEGSYHTLTDKNLEQDSRKEKKISVIRSH